jgi:uncharacterized protein (DUF924 family)
MTADDVLAFWFGPPGTSEVRAEWFKKDPAFDQSIRERFGPLVETALAGGLLDWSRRPDSALARILLLDQFTRNAFRDTPRAFEGDTLALAEARAMVASGQVRQLPPLRLAFVYLPFEHAEDLPMQDESVRLFEDLVALDPARADMLDYARRHREVIARFGRFPHRNEILGRESTPEELAFLAQPGSRF